MGPAQYLRSKLKRRVDGAREALAEGWRELLSRSNSALTQFAAPAKQDGGLGSQEHLQWSLLAAETWETALTVIIRIEIPGVTKEEVRVEIIDNALRIRGARHSGEEQGGRLYHLMERAYGSFERTVPLPDGIDAKRFEVSYQDGVITVIVQKTQSVPPR